ncbi:DNA (cytosine-5-)-methyltransferase [Brevibacillus sp. AY1]|uniref:DNA (cytosine-5-)-methyltransferase n=1 Tax=Brevibacillus sp. AY1 TaxID=2807621 RepID=UPI0024551469|nr:DNA (cytosine-5-)-methyltransferase [Brevibacillus sp. AY1]MDH4616485.1 DNA (cytosine-5-)-methyltransferase [Brevibacillus sp. AY1]
MRHQSTTYLTESFPLHEITLETNGLEKTSNSDESGAVVFNHVFRRSGSEVQKRINALKIGQKMQDLPEELWHDSFRYYVKEDPNRRGGPNMRMIRLDPSKPSLTVTGYIFNKFVHPYENRFITVREAARLQGFPDSLKFEGSLTSTQMQVGNAVPVQLAKAVFEAVLISVRKLGYGKRNLTAFSLFSGAGGLDIGAEQATYKSMKIETLVTLDNWKDACDTLRGFYQGRASVLQGDISEIQDPKLLWHQESKCDQVPDIVFGGPPCQAFSQAGKQKATNDPRGNLIYEYLRFIEKISPPFFVMENVANLKGVQRGELYRDILERMSNLGYNVTVAPLLAADYGAPQLRKRLIFLGCKKELGVMELPVPTHSDTPDLLSPNPYVSVGEAFKGLPRLV